MRRLLARPASRAAVVETSFGLALLTLVGVGTFWGWRRYERDVLPFARVVPTLTPTVSIDPTAAREQGRRQRLVNDLLASGNAFRAAGRTDLAIRDYLAVIEIDPDHVDARQGLRELGLAPPPAGRERTPTPVPPTPQPTVTVRP